MTDSVEHLARKMRKVAIKTRSKLYPTKPWSELRPAQQEYWRKIALAAITVTSK